MKKNNVKDILKAFPLGGNGEIGKNCWVFEYKDEIIIVNFGFMLPGNNLSGVDLIFPNPEYLIENQEKIKGLILTSAHDDCCGGIFYLLGKVKIPQIWGSNLAIETIKSQFSEKQELPKINFLKSREEFQLGPYVITPLVNTSVLPESFGLYIKTGVGNILYTGSYKIDQTPPDGTLLDYYMYSKAGEDGVDLLISDSTNIESSGYSQSEKHIIKRFDELIKNSSSRLIIVSYASCLHKFQILFNLAQKYNKKVCLLGNFLIKKINAALTAKVMTAAKDLFIPENQIEETGYKDLIVIASGKNGDFLSSLIEIANQKNKHVTLKSDDIIVVSSNPPPGTVRILARTIDELFVQKVQVIGGKEQGVHVSGHAAEEEAKFMLSIAKPRCFVPSLGEERQLVKYAAIAEVMGINANDVHVISNGNVIELREQIVRVAGKVPAQSIYYNHIQGLDIDEITMKDRLTLSEEGTITVALAIDEKKNIIAGPEIIAEACAFAKGKDWRAFCLGTIELIKDAVKQTVEKKEAEPLKLKTVVRNTVTKSVLELIGKRPLINVSIQEIGSPVKQL